MAKSNQTVQVTRGHSPEGNPGQDREAGEGAGKRGKLSPRPQRGTTAEKTLLDITAPPLADLSEQVRAKGGVPIAGYAEPFSGQPLLLASLPIGALQPTPFQRDLSPTHAKRLTRMLAAAKKFNVDSVNLRDLAFVAAAAEARD